MRHADDIISGRQPGVSMAAVTWRECLGRRGGDSAASRPGCRNYATQIQLNRLERVFFCLPSVCTLYTQGVYVCVSVCVCLK